MSSPMSRTSFSVPVSPAAAGSSDQATPRSPEAAPRRRQTSKLSSRPTTVSTQAERLPGRGVDGSTRPAYGRGWTRMWRRCATHPRPRLRGRRRERRTRLTAALAAYDAAPDDREPARTLAVLQRRPLLVPVVAVLGEVEYDDAGPGPRQDLRHGHRADDRPRRPHGAARVHLHREPAAVEPRRPGRSRSRLRKAALAAVQQEAAAVLVDVAGPVMFVVESDDLLALADERLIVRRVRPARLVSLCVTDLLVAVRPGGSDKRRPPPTRTGRQILIHSTTGRRVPVPSRATRCRRTARSPRGFRASHG